MSYLILSDFQMQIQSDNLQQIIGSKSSVLSKALATAQEEAESKLIQKYETSSEFTDTMLWDSTKIYKAADRVYLDAPVYDSSKLYALGNLTLYAGVVYICTTAITVAESFTSAKWTSIGNQYDLFYVTYPGPVFDISGAYNVGDVIYWKGKKYTARIKTTFISHQEALQYGDTDNIPYPNYFPDDPINGPHQWTFTSNYSVPAGTLPTNTTYWTFGDNRSQVVVMCIVDMALYHIHSRIAPRSIPDLRVKRYDDAKKELIEYARGKATAHLTKIQPPQGKRIRWGSQVKNQNNY